MGKIKNQIDPNSILSRGPQLYENLRQTSNRNGVDLVVNQDEVCRLYVENWKQPGRDKIPNGFIQDQAVVDLLQDPSNSVVSETNPYIKFLIDTIQPQFQETILPIKNFSHGFVTYVFGQEPVTVNFSGVLVRTAFDNWSELFLSIYHYFLRASKLAELSLLNKTSYQVVIQYQGKIYKGSIINLGKVTTAVNESAVAFNFQMLVKELKFQWKPTNRLSLPSNNIASESRTKLNSQGNIVTLNTIAIPQSPELNSVRTNPAFTA